jgi:hypothetical protein
MLLLANLEIGLHEQTRLQPEIEEALNAPIPDLAQLREDLLQALTAQRSVSRALWQRPDLGQTRARLAKKARRLARQTITEHMMTLRLSNDRLLHVGQDLRNSFPPELQQIDNPDLQALLQQIDPTPHSLKDTGTDDWGNLADRLHFIADMFRAYEEDGGLLGPPFTLEQVMKLKAGQRPAGRL